MNEGWKRFIVYIKSDCSKCKHCNIGIQSYSSDGTTWKFIPVIFCMITFLMFDMNPQRKCDNFEYSDEYIQHIKL